MARQRPTRLVMGPCIYQLEVYRCRNEDMWPGRTDGQTADSTISLPFSKSVGITSIVDNSHWVIVDLKWFEPILPIHPIGYMNRLKPFKWVIVNLIWLEGDFKPNHGGMNRFLVTPG
ncbi:hypothetical protein DPMN_032229 [Dreissena polymorpha]|uniref:Uncharacterized protein n=1 Tax=Dreissena polymorpha TaxID=45954 RepID=A0A9D4RHS2_DREPO|nr:hypothetical protein DPMN_032229 [Dreissena polymorpha]